MGLLEYIFPRKCLGCGRVGGYFCADCLNMISLCGDPVCPVCNNFSPGGLTHTRCLGRFTLDGLTSVFAYRGIVKKAIKKIKYRYVSDVARELTEAFLSVCGEDQYFAALCRRPEIALVSIPLHSSKQRVRGFNQTEVIGKKIAVGFGLPFWSKMLVRTKPTRAQFSLDKKDRESNIRGAFAANHELVSKNAKIILLDDIWGSGSTLREAGRVLKRSGAKFVWGLTVCR